MDGALADYNRAIELDPKDASAYYNRGAVYFVAGEWKRALSDFHRRCEVSPRNQDYPRLLIWLIRKRNGEVNTDEELASYLGKRSGSVLEDWFSKLAAYLLDRVTEADLFAAAKSPDREKASGHYCEAWFYAGMKKLLGKHYAGAAEYFKKCLAVYM